VLYIVNTLYEDVMFVTVYINRSLKLGGIIPRHSDSDICFIHVNNKVSLIDYGTVETATIDISNNLLQG